METMITYTIISFVKLYFAFIGWLTNRYLWTAITLFQTCLVDEGTTGRTKGHRSSCDLPMLSCHGMACLWTCLRDVGVSQPLPWWLFSIDRQVARSGTSILHVMRIIFMQACFLSSWIPFRLQVSGNAIAKQSKHNVAYTPPTKIFRKNHHKQHRTPQRMYSLSEWISHLYFIHMPSTLKPKDPLLSDH